VRAIVEDALRDGSLACVSAQARSADMTATRRLQLAPLPVYRGNIALRQIAFMCGTTISFVVR
jgi:hypothetical protein